MRYEIGRFGNKPAFFVTGKAHNGHIVLTGASGSGKTTQGINLMIQAAKQGAAVIALDIHNIFSEDQVIGELKENFERLSVSKDVYSEGLCIPLFTKGTFRDGTEENEEEVIGNVANIIATAYRLGNVQKSVLRQAMDFVYEENLYQKYGITIVDMVLKRMGTDKSEEVADRISEITNRNVFRDGEKFLEEGKINIIRLSKFSLDMQSLISEVVMNYLWRLANQGQFAEKGVCLFVDECHNYNMGKTGILSRMMMEGRKLGINLILATQLINSQNFLSKLMMQAGLVMFFKPAKNEVKEAARLIDKESQKSLCMDLRRLKVGEFMSGGTVVLGKNTVENPLIIAVDLKKREEK